MKKQEIKKYLKYNDLYNILLISSKNSNLYNYRQILVKEKIPSIVMYTNNPERLCQILKLEGSIELGDNPQAKLPIVVKIKNNKILSVKTDVTIDNLKEKMK